MPTRRRFVCFVPPLVLGAVDSPSLGICSRAVYFLRHQTRLHRYPLKSKVRGQRHPTSELHTASAARTARSYVVAVIAVQAYVWAHTKHLEASRRAWESMMMILNNNNTPLCSQRQLATWRVFNPKPPVKSKTLAKFNFFPKRCRFSIFFPNLTSQVTLFFDYWTFLNWNFCHGLFTKTLQGFHCFNFFSCIFVTFFLQFF